MLINRINFEYMSHKDQSSNKERSGKKECFPIDILFGVFFIIAALILTGCVNNPTEKSPQKIRLNVGNDTTIGPMDTLLLRVEDPLQGRYRFFWEVDNQRLSVSGSDSILLFWPVSDSGKHTVVTGVLKQDHFIPETTSITVKISRPSVKIVAPEEVTVNDTAVFYTNASDKDGRIVNYRWSVDKNGQFWHSTTADSFTIVWDNLAHGRHIVRAIVTDDDGLSSKADSVVVNVKVKKPSVTLHAQDTVLFANDTLELRALAKDSNGVVTGFIWNVDGVISHGASDSLRLSWKPAAAGVHVISVASVDDDSLLSVPDTVFARIDPGYPVVTKIPDTLVSGVDSVKLSPEASDPNGSIKAYLWDIDADGVWDDTTKVSRKTVSFTGNNIIYRVIWAALDSDSLISSDTVVITRNRAPQIICPDLQRIDTLEFLETEFPYRLVFTAQFLDPEDDPLDTEIMFRRLPDSTAYEVQTADDNTYSIQVDSAGIYNWKLSAADIHGERISVEGLITIIKNKIPNTAPQIICPDLQGIDSLLLANREFPYRLDFAVRFLDPENEPLDTEIIFWRLPDSTASELQTADGINYSLFINAAGIYNWRIRAVDIHGDETSVEGQIVVIKEHTICFAGHSIVVGLAGDHTQGGFRSRVLSGLRDTLPAFEKLKARGPITTVEMNGSADDSCLAVSGTKTPEMQVLLASGFPRLTADIWVLMMGTNAQFSTAEMRGVVKIMDLMYQRNPESKIYVLNSPPYPDNPTWQYYNQYYLPPFNKALQDTIDDRSAKGYKVFLVDAYSVLTKDSLLDTTVFVDHVHPNQTGYDILGDKILQTMFSSTPAAVPFRKSEEQ